jgi:hypothetical protein
MFVWAVRSIAPLEATRNCPFLAHSCNGMKTVLEWLRPYLYPYLRATVPSPATGYGAHAGCASYVNLTIPRLRVA